PNEPCSPNADLSTTRSRRSSTAREPSCSKGRPAGSSCPNPCARVSGRLSTPSAMMRPWRVAPIHTSLTTQEAAEDPGISRPSLIKLLEEGKIEYTRPGRHRRIELRALLAYQESLKQVRREALEAMAAADAELPEATYVGFPRTR